MNESGNEDNKPTWWVRNEHLRAELGLPPYEPPRFADGVPTHTVVESLEENYECQIRFQGKNTEYPDDFEVSVDGKVIASIGRHRDDNGNTVYEQTSTEFRQTINEVLTNNDESQ